MKKGTNTMLKMTSGWVRVNIHGALRHEIFYTPFVAQLTVDSVNAL